MTQLTLEEAEREFAASVAYYESREPGLGLRSQGAVDGLWPVGLHKQCG